MRAFNLVKSLTRVYNFTPSLLGKVGKGLRLLILCLSLATFGVNEAWGKAERSWSASVAVGSGKGSVKAVIYKHGISKSEEKTATSTNSTIQTANVSASGTTVLSISNRSCQYFVNSADAGYSWDGWYKDAACTTLQTKDQTFEAWEKTTDNKNVTFYAKFTPSSAVVTTNAGVTAQDPATSVSGSVVFTVSNADALADFKKPESITTISGIGSFSVGEWSYADGKITINYTYTPNNTSKETKGELKLVSAGGEKTCTATITGKANKKTTTIVWDIPTFILNKDEEVSDPAHAENGAEVKYKIKSGQPTDVIAISGSTLTGLKEGTCVIIAYLEGDEDVWAYQENEQTFTVTNKQKQTIDWNQKLSFNWTSGTLTETLDASANTPITYSIPSSASGWVTVSGTTLSIKGTGETTITATAAETDEYIGVSVTRTLIARDPTATCDDPMYEDGNSHEFNDNYTIEYFTLHPRSLAFQACKSMLTAVGSLEVREYYGGDWHTIETIDIGNLKKDDFKDFGPYNLNYNTTRLRFVCNGSYKRTVKNIKVLQAKSISADVSEIKLEGQIGTQKPYTFYITYDNVQGPLYVTSNETSVICPSELAADCGDAATNREVKITLNPTTSFSGKTLTISDQKDGGRTLTIPISATVSKNSQSIIWNDGTSYNSTDLYTLTATATSGLPVSYAIVSGPAQIVNNNQIQFTGIGSIQVKACQGGNEYYSPALDVTKTFSVSKVTPAISTNPTATATITYGQKLNTVSLSGGAAKVNPFRGQATDHTVTGSFAWTNGDYTVVETGGTTHEYDVTFTPTGAEAGMYNNASCKATVTVNKITPTLTAKNEADLEVYVNDTQTPKLNLVDYITEYSAADDTHGHVQAKSAITFACNQDGAVIEGNKFYATKAGTYTITATAPATDYYNSQTTTFTIKAINYYYSQAKSVVATNATTGKDGGWVSVWQGSKDSASIADNAWLHEDQTSNYKRLTETTHPYYFRAKVGTGYTFAGWFTSAEAAEPEYTKPTYDANFTVTNRDRENPWITRYAKFTPITYIVKFVGNGNTGGSMSDQTFTYDVAQNLTPNGFTRTGWSFTGWKDGNGITYTEKQSVNNLASTQGAIITMTAQWNQDIYTVILDPASYGTGGTTQISVKYNESIPASIAPPFPTDPAYKFLGYYLDITDESTKYYDENGVAISGKKWMFTEGKTLTAKWQAGDYIKSWDVAESYTAQSNIPYDIAKSFSGRPVTYSIVEESVEGMITIVNNEQNGYIYANKKGTATIMACPKVSTEYPSVSCDTHEITIVGKEQIIEWNQNFSFMAARDGSINTYSNSLQAVSKDTLGTPTGRTVTYTSSNENVAKVESDGQVGWRLHVIGYGTDGTCTITASAAGNDIYEPGSIDKTIRIVREGDKCGTTIYKQSEDSKYKNGIIFNATEPKTISFGVVPCDSISFKIKHAWQIFSTKECIITMTDSKGNKYTVYEGTATQEQTPEEVKYRVPEEAAACQQIDFKTGANVNYTVTNLEVKQRSYLKPTVAAPMSYDPATNTYPIDLNVSIGDYANNVQFVINYSDEQPILYSIEGDAENAFVLTPDREIDNTCGDVGSYTFTLKTTKTWWIEKTITATIKIYTSSGDQVIIPVSVHYTLGNQYQLAKQGDLSAELDWEDPNNWWLRDGTHPTTPPTMKNPVMILNPVRINSHAEAYEITKGETAPGKVRITIAPEGGLTVFTGGITGFDYDKVNNHSRIVIESSKDHQGYLRLSPDMNMPTMKMPTGTIQLATKSTLDNGANDDAVWQYIGVPVVEYDDFEGKDLEDMPFTVDYITWLYEWSEPKGWVDMKNVSQPVRLKPFTGYAITQYGQPIYEFTGRFLHDNVRIPLTYTDEPGMLGDNVIANSYTSPIDVTLVDQTDFEGGNVIQAFYVFNSGSYNQWKEQNKEGDGRGKQSGSLNNYTPGQYIAIPTKSGAELGENELTMIAPMQGFDIYATEKGKTAYFNLNYRKHVWNAGRGSETVNKQMNEPIRAPKTDDTYMPDDVARQYAIWDSIKAAKQARIDAITNRVRLIAYGKNSGNDRVVIIESPLYAKQYENGADAPKHFSETEGLLGLYTNEQDCGLMSVNATNSADGMYIGFRAGDDSEYTLSASNVIGGSLQLIDLQTMQTINLKDSAVYTFTAEPNSQDDFRFQIINQNIHVNPTGWGGLGAKAKIWYYEQALYISDAAANSTAAIYTAAGELLEQVTFNHNTSISTEDMPEGVYTVRVEDSVLKFFVKH